MRARIPEIHQVYGVDFSGARLSGLTAWLAATQVDQPAEGDAPILPRLRLLELDPLGTLAGNDDRDAVNRYLVASVRGCERALWGFDFPFGLPVELGIGRWKEQLAHVAEFVGQAQDYGRLLVRRSREVDGSLHIRRLTDREAKTPFDCYHYRIIHQTFHGMRDILCPLSRDVGVCVLPFQFARITSSKASPRSLVVEACPSSTLKRLSLPHRLYKQSGGKPPTESHREVRREILAGLNRFVEISPRHRRAILANPGGDALDAVLAAVGVWNSIVTDEHDAIARHGRYPLEGRVYA
jgi:hypothetical protein